MYACAAITQFLINLCTQVSLPVPSAYQINHLLTFLLTKLTRRYLIHDLPGDMVECCLRGTTHFALPLRKISERVK